MSSSTALLPKDRKKDDHPIFLRVCHSPWVGIGQNALVSLRGIVTAYLLVSFLMIIRYEITRNENSWLTAFEFSNIVYLVQLIYAIIAFTWTFMHLHYPHHSIQAQSCATRFQKFFSPPRQHPATKNRAFFSIFYTAAVTYPHVVTLIHWAILVPKNETTVPVDQLLRSDWYTQFFIINKNGVNSIIAIIEVFFFSSIKRQVPVFAHIFGLIVLSLLYVLWANIGYLVLAREYEYFFLNYHKIGWEYAVVAVIAFCVLADILFFVVYGITGLREIFTKKGEDKSYGYTRLPQ